MTRECGTCTLCCKLLAIEELSKPQGTWCPHCKPGKGCMTYPTRPQSCQDFQCLWLRMEELPEELQPSQCKCVLGFTADGRHVVVYVSPEYPTSYRTNPAMKEFILTTLQQGTDVYIVTGNEHKMLPAKRSTNLVDLNMHLPTQHPEDLLK